MIRKLPSRMNCIPVLLTILIVMAATVVGAQDDEARRVYREARAMVREGDYLEAAKAFDSVAQDHTDSREAAEALYWKAFSLYREGGRRHLRDAVDALELQLERYPEVAKGGDSADLAIRIRGELAELGDSEAAEQIAQFAEQLRLQGEDGSAPDAREDETRIAALNALLQMSPERALPILEKILVEKPDKYSADFREQAVFLVSQHAEEGAGLDLLLHVIREDKNPEVRAQAVFWLGQTQSDVATQVLTEILRDNDEDPELRDKAIFSLSQIGGKEAGGVLRDLAMDQSAATHLREQAIFWLSQNDDERVGTDFLIDLYGSLDEAALKEKVIFSVSQLGGKGAEDFLLARVRDRDEDIELRNHALFWLGQSEDMDVDAILDLFAEMDEPELQEQAIFVIGQIDDDRAVDALLDIARNAQDGDIRAKAIFWLGQADDDRAAEYLMQILEEEF